MSCEETISHSVHSIRSFVRRQGRITTGQKKSIARLGSRYGVTLKEGPLDLNALFHRSHPKILEIGFGNGETLSHMARTYSDQDFLGVEVYRPGVGHLLHLIEKYAIENLRVICEDATKVLACLMPESLDRVQIFFPDPWPKRRQHKRRLIQPHFLRHLSLKMKKNAQVHLATDSADYAAHMLDSIEAVESLENINGPRKAILRPEYRLMTKFEQRGLQLGHETFDIIAKNTI